MKLSVILVNNKRADGRQQLYFNISHKGERYKKATGFFITTSEWDASAQKVNKKHSDFQKINNYLADTRAKWEKNERDLIIYGEPYTIADIIADKSPDGDFVQYCKNEVKRRKELGKIQYSQENCYWNVIELLEQFGGAVIPFKKVNMKFVKDLHDFVIKTKADCSPTTKRKYQNHLRTFFNCAMDDRLIEPINWRRIELVKAKYREIESITSEQLKEIEARPITNEHINFIRDLFLFGCYTGCAFSDIMKLTPNNIQRDGQKIWLKYNRTKNQQLAKVPLHYKHCAKALPLIEKYSDSKRKTLFPHVTNQNANKNLKIIQEIYQLTNVEKLGTHVARHTFITLMLQFGVDIYNVKICAGHKKISTTQKYVHDASIDMERNLREADFDD